MKTIIDHLVHTLDSEEMAKKSFFDCHVKGLHSLMLQDNEAGRIRVFFTDIYHELYKSHPMSLGIHQHRNDLSLHCIKGAFVNNKYHINSFGTNILEGFRFQSKIVEGQVGFTSLGFERLYCHRKQMMVVGDMTFMKAEEFHTVYVPEKKESAWIVYEGKPSENYNDTMYSNATLSQLKTMTADLYRPITEEQYLAALMKLTNL